MKNKTIDVESELILALYRLRAALGVFEGFAVIGQGRGPTVVETNERRVEITRNKIQPDVLYPATGYEIAISVLINEPDNIPERTSYAISATANQEQFDTFLDSFIANVAKAMDMDEQSLREEYESKTKDSKRAHERFVAVLSSVAIMASISHSQNDFFRGEARDRVCETFKAEMKSSNRTPLENIKFLFSKGAVIWQENKTDPKKPRILKLEELQNISFSEPYNYFLEAKKIDPSYFDLPIARPLGCEGVIGNNDPDLIPK